MKTQWIVVICIILILMFMLKKPIVSGLHNVSDQVIDSIIKFIIKYNEGGYVSAKRAAEIGDTGGETNFGISKKAYPNLDIKNLTIEQAAKIYRQDYLKPLLSWLPLNDPQLLYQVFDMAINSGVAGAKSIYVPGMTAEQYKQARLKKYATFKLWNSKDPATGRYLIRESWTNRANRNYA